MSPRIEEAQVLGTSAVVLVAGDLEVTVLVGKGADVLFMRHRPTGISPLWEPRWARRPIPSQLHATSSAQAWFDACRGGWHVLVPSGAVEANVGGAWQPDHSEATVAPWQVVADAVVDDEVSVTLATGLTRSPLCLTRSICLDRSGRLELRDRAVNQGGETFPLTWVHHPTLGPPFLSDACRLTTNAVRWAIDDDYPAPHSPYPPGATGIWPPYDDQLSRIPSRNEPRQLLAYLDYEPDADAWYSVDNAALNLRFRLTWSASQLPAAWFFQEMDATAGYPWFSNSYLMALEPASCAPARPLDQLAAAGLAHHLAPDESHEVSVTASFGPITDLTS